MAPPVRRPVVAAVNLSTDDAAVIRLAAAEAAGRRAPLRLLRVRDGAPGTAEESLRRARRLVGRRYPDLAVTTGSSPEAPAAALVEAARGAALVVVGQRSGGAVPAGVPLEVAARATCPVLVTPPGCPPGTALGPVVVGVKGRDRDAAAVLAGLRRAARQRAPVRVVHVWVNTPDMEYASIDPFIYDLAEAGRDADRLIEAAIGGLQERYPQVSVQRVPLYRLDVAEALVDLSAGAGLLVLGPARHERAGAAALGPVGRALIGRAACPVMVSQWLPGPGVSDQAAVRRVRSALELLQV